jgi:hypothetical protein
MTVTARRRSGASTAAVAIHVVADVVAAIIGLWILLYLLEANPSNDLVGLIHDCARWLAGWSHDLFSIDTEWVRGVVNYGIAAVAYLFIGHALAARLRH